MPRGVNPPGVIVQLFYFDFCLKKWLPSWIWLPSRIFDRQNKEVAMVGFGWIFMCTLFGCI